MSVITYLSNQAGERKDLLLSIHEIIIDGDPSVKAEEGKMMGKEMILYQCDGMFKYGLCSAKNYMSLHILPIYVSPKLHDKFEKLLSKAAFQKGCINFATGEEMPLNIVKQLIKESSEVDLKAIRENYEKRRPKK